MKKRDSLGGDVPFNVPKRLLAGARMTLLGVGNNPSFQETTSWIIYREQPNDYPIVGNRCKPPVGNHPLETTRCSHLGHSTHENPSPDPPLAFAQEPGERLSPGQPPLVQPGAAPSPGDKKRSDVQRVSCGVTCGFSGGHVSLGGFKPSPYVCNRGGGFHVGPRKDTFSRGSEDSLAFLGMGFGGMPIFHKHRRYRPYMWYTHLHTSETHTGKSPILGAPAFGLPCKLCPVSGCSLSRLGHPDAPSLQDRVLLLTSCLKIRRNRRLKPSVFLLKQP